MQVDWESASKKGSKASKKAKDLRDNFVLGLSLQSGMPNILINELFDKPLTSHKGEIKDLEISQEAARDIVYLTKEKMVSNVAWIQIYKDYESIRVLADA